MNCPACQSDNPPAARFCMHCGAPIDSSPAPSLEAAAFSRAALDRLVPREVLEQLRSSSGRVSGERRVVTIMFFDVVGSTAMAEGLDPEEVMDLMNEAFQSLVEPVCRHGGTLARLMGDGVLAFFGAPLAHEDDAERACHAALGVVERAHDFAADLAKTRGIPGFDVRVGLHTGLVAVGEVGGDLRVEYTAMGDAVNLASRLEGMATPGAVFLSERTQRLASESFFTEDCGTIDVKGRRTPVRVFALTGVKPPQEARPVAPFVDREGELDHLLGALRELRAGSGGAIAVLGQPGIGKSRLVAETRAADERDVSWTVVAGSSHTHDVAHGMVRAMVRELLGVDDATPAELVTQQLAELFAGDAGDAQARIARDLLGRLLALAGREGYEPPPEMEGDERLARACRSLLAPPADHPARVVVWDDLHWADEPSLCVIERLVASATEDRVLHVLVARTGEARTDTFLDRLAPPRVELGPLPPDDAALLVSHLMVSPAEADPIAAVVAGCAEGNPLFIEEIVRSIGDAGAPGETGVGSAAGQWPLPDSLRTAIMSRMDRLHPTDKRVLQTAAVIGRTLDRAVLAEIASTEASAEELEGALAQLVARSFLSPRGDTELTFPQTLVHEVAYSSLLRSERRRLHHRTAEVMKTVFAGRTHEIAAELAWHYERAHALREALPHAVQAARQAPSADATRKAIERYTRALEKTSAAEAPPGEREAIHEALGDMHYVTGAYEKALRHYRSAERAGMTTNDKVRLLRKQGQVCEKWGKTDDARTLFASARSAVDETVDPVEVAYACTGAGRVSLRLGALDEARELGRQALESMEASGDRRGVAMALDVLGIVHGRSEDWAAAAEYHERALALFDAAGDDFGCGAAHNNLGLACIHLGRFEAALEHLERACGLFERLGNSHGLARTYDNLSHLYLDRNDMERATDYQRRAAVILSEIAADGDDLRPEMWQSGTW